MRVGFELVGLVLIVLMSASSPQSASDRILVRNVKSGAIEAHRGMFVNDIELFQSPERGLREYGIISNGEALIIGLRSRVSEVRSLAAAKLASDGAKHAIQNLVTALQKEADAGTKANLAFALGWLGDERGLDALTDMCDDTTLATGVRLRATRQVLDLGADACQSTLSEVLHSKSDDAAIQVLALTLLPRFAGRGTSSTSSLAELAALRLEHPNPHVRIAAADALACLRSSASIPQMRAALAREENYEVQTHMKAALRKLSNNSSK